MLADPAANALACRIVAPNRDRAPRFLLRAQQRSRRQHRLHDETAGAGIHDADGAQRE
jgi:hypothetical protein